MKEKYGRFDHLDNSYCIVTKLDGLLMLHRNYWRFESCTQILTIILIQLLDKTTYDS
jgi:hypothetical protein